jgi:hypothetical protein
MADKKKVTAKAKGPEVSRDADGHAGLQCDENTTLVVKALPLLMWATAMDRAMLSGDPAHMIIALSRAKPARDALMDAAMEAAGIQKTPGMAAMFGEGCEHPSHQHGGKKGLDAEDMNAAIANLLRNIGGLPGQS